MGWGGRKSGGALEPPTQARDLEIVKTGKDWVLLDWKQPAEGGYVAAYEVQAHKAEEEVWREVGPAAFGLPVCTLAGCHHYPDPRLLDRSRET